MPFTSPAFPPEDMGLVVLKTAPYSEAERILAERRIAAQPPSFSHTLKRVQAVNRAAQPLFGLREAFKKALIDHLQLIRSVASKVHLFPTRNPGLNNKRLTSYLAVLALL